MRYNVLYLMDTYMRTMMLTKLIYFPTSTPQPPRPTKALTPVRRFLTVAIAYIRVMQKWQRLPIVLPLQWGFWRMMDISVNGFPERVDTLAELRKHMDKSRKRWGVVAFADTVGQMGAAA